MTDATPRIELPPPGTVAWLSVSAEDSNGATGLVRTGPLGLQIAPLPQSRAPYFFKGARLRGTRSVWSAATVSGAVLRRVGRGGITPVLDGAVHILARVEAPGSVFDPGIRGTRGVMRLTEPGDDLNEQLVSNTHLFTLNVHQAGVGIEPSTLSEMTGRTFEITQFQEGLLRSAVGLLTCGAEELITPASLVGIDRYLCALAGLLLRTAVAKPSGEPEQLESVRAKTDAIIFEQAADPQLSPATIAAQLNISLRQLYRAFNQTESPAARIRRRRLERAAELLSARSPQPQVEKVAQECGFASAEYFSRAFRREFGISPRAYRSAHRDAATSAR
ncbi:MAG TPA: helix-turn-helix domain-containing protein [Jatrophihabitantaceae bacterium]|nr:helix-turn-helix domain-containing protein [Jatrophihabitantaceae bacterium]